MIIGLIAAGYWIDQPIAFAVLAIVAVGLERQSIRLSPQLEVSVASLVYIFAAVVFGPLAGVLVAVAGLLVVLPRRDVEQPLLRWMTWTSASALSIGGAGLTALMISDALGRNFLGLFAAVSGALAVESFLDIVLTATTMRIRGSGSWLETAGSLGPALVFSVPLHAPMVAVLAYAYTEISPWSVVLFAAPAIAAQRLLQLYRRQRQDTEALGIANARLARANLSFATALAAEAQELAHVCGLVHDVGKIGLAAGLLEKPGALSLEERRQMEQHSIIGERILRNVEDYSEIAAIVRHHHERVDGNGYPDRLEREEIPLLARIIAVADAYNAMTSDRPYRDAMPSRVARLRLAQAVESQFDTSVVAAFEAILAGANEAYRTATDPEFALTQGSFDEVDEPASVLTTTASPSTPRVSAFA
jgi:HD domain